MLPRLLPHTWLQPQPAATARAALTEGSSQSLKEMGPSPVCSQLPAHSHRGSAACRRFFNPLEPEAWAFLAATAADTASPSLDASIPHCQLDAHEGSLSLCRRGHIHRLMSETQYHVLGHGLPGGKSQLMGKPSA